MERNATFRRISDPSGNRNPTFHGRRFVIHQVRGDLGEKGWTLDVVGEHVGADSELELTVESEVEADDTGRLDAATFTSSRMSFVGSRLGTDVSVASV